MRFHFRCTECHSVYEEKAVELTCPECARNQAKGGETRGILEVVLESLPTSWPTASFPCSDFLTAFLPVRSADLAPLAVGGTPLLTVPGLRRSRRMKRLFVKDDGRNPSGSTKDRASLLVAAKARQYGRETIATASTGNAATAIAAVAAAAGLRTVVFVPAAAPEGKLVQMLAYGARVIPVEGTYDDAFELCLAACERFGWYNRNTAQNPFTVEGKKTVALEIARQLAPEVADVVLVPTGDGVILSGVAKGFADLERAGLLERRPRLIAAQPAGSAAIARAFRDGRASPSPVAGAASVADSLVVSAPRGGRLCLARLRESAGGAVAVDDEAILAALAELARTTGVFAEPAAAAALAGLDAALEEGLLERGERVVLLITGHGLKDIAAAARAVERPAAVAPRLEAVEEALGTVE